MEKYLYFRTQTALADDDAKDDSVCFPLSSLLGMTLVNDGRMKLLFIPLIRISGGVSDGEDFTNADSIVLNLKSENNHKAARSEEHTSELQSRLHLVCRLLLEKKKKKHKKKKKNITIR